MTGDLDTGIPNGIAMTLGMSDHDLPHGFEVQFNTAWAPPEEICRAMRKQFPDTDIQWFYDEPGEAIAGYL